MGCAKDMKYKSKYKAKPVEIEAIQWIYGDPDNDKEIIKFIGDDSHLFDIETAINYHTFTTYIKRIVIKKAEYYMRVFAGDYIIRGINGRYYSCSKNDFENNFEEVETND